MNDSPPINPVPVPSDARVWGMLTHLIAFCGWIVPFGHLLGPLVIWLIKKDQMPFVDDQGKESLNFQLTMTLATIVGGILMLVVVGFFLLIAIFVVDVVFVIIASVKANEGQFYRYPFCLRLIK